MLKDGKTPKKVQAGRVLVDSAKRGKTFRPPAGQSRAGARKELFG